MIEKVILRNSIRDKKRQFTNAQLEELSLAIIQRLLDNTKFNDARTILMYYSLPDEVNTHKLVVDMAKKGKRILLPHVIDKENMELREYTSFEDLRTGSFNIMEPIGKKFTKLDEIDTAIIPGMGFDNHGNRLGRGKGYYDRFLKLIPKAHKIGICFDYQKIEHIPTGIYDVKMDEIL